MTLTLGILANLGFVVSLFLMSRKLWWAPIFGVCSQVFWYGYAWALGVDGWPMFVSASAAAITYVVAIPKWRRERQ